MTTAKFPYRLTIFVIGCPGAGKGTLCKILAAEYDGCHISVGDILRATVQDEQSIERVELIPYIRNGTLIPTNLLVQILNRAITKDAQKKQRFLMLDGFPRRLQQGIEVESVFGRPDLVLFFNCDKETAEQRYQSRQLPGRENDNPEMFEQRYAEYAVLNRDVLQHYRWLGKLVEIDTGGETDASYRNLLRELSIREEWSGQLAVVEAGLK